jgi:hypothetical protein
MMQMAKHAAIYPKVEDKGICWNSMKGWGFGVIGDSLNSQAIDSHSECWPFRRRLGNIHI